MAIYYVDFGTGDDSTGDGSSGNPWKTCQYAIDNGTWSSTSGNTLKIGNNAAEVLTSLIDTSSIATLEAPLCMEGWDNGGSITATGPHGSTISPCAEIDGNDAVAYITQSNTLYTTFKNLKLHSTTTYVLRLSTGSQIINCEIYNAGTTYTLQATTCEVINCYIHTDAAAGSLLYGPSVAMYCELEGGDEGIWTADNNCVIAYNFIHGFEDSGVYIVRDYGNIFNNTIDGIGAASTAVGIEAVGGSYEHNKIYNNLITNFDGATAKGIYLPAGSPPSVLGNNAFYNNTTNVDSTDAGCNMDNIIETSDPYVDSANNDFSLRDGALSQNSAIFKPIP